MLNTGLNFKNLIKNYVEKLISLLVCMQFWV